MSAPRIVVFAYSDVGHAGLSFLLERGENVVGVYTHDDKPGETIWFPSVLKLARERKRPVRTADDLLAREESDALRALAPDLIFSFYYRNLLPPSVLRLPRLGAFNMHGSLLPAYRGRAPINWAVLHGETTTGATLHAMTEQADAGDIIDQQAVAIGPDDTAATVQAGVTAAAVQVLARQIENLKNGTAPRISQDANRASYFGRRRAEDGAIDWAWPAARVHNLVRAVSHPYPGAFGRVLGEKTWIWKTRLSANSPVAGNAGDIRVDGERLFVACGDGRLLEILSLQKPNGPEITGADFARENLMTSEEKKS